MTVWECSFTCKFLEMQKYIQFSNQCYFTFRNIIRKPWIQALNASDTPIDFARALTVLQCCIKPCLMVNVWYETLGDTMLKEISQPMKDDKKKSEEHKRYTFLKIYFLETKCSVHILQYKKLTDQSYKSVKTLGTVGFNQPKTMKII